jgi:hypothetical protein
MADMYSDPSSAANNPYLQKSNPYLQSNIDAAQGDIVRNWNNAVQPGYTSAMVKSGSFGNEGVAQANQNAAYDTQKALGNVSNSMRMQDYGNQQNLYMQQQGIDNSNYWNNNNFNRSLYNDAYSQNMNNLTTGIGLLGTLSGYNANDLTNANTIQNTPLNYWSNFSNAANGIGQGYGTSQSQTGSTSNPFMGALGGAQLGQAAMGWWNNQGRANSGGSPTDANGYSLSNYGSGGSADGVTPYL